MKTVWNSQKSVYRGVCDAGNCQKSTGHDIKPLSLAIFAEIDKLCKLTSNEKTQKRSISALLRHLMLKNWN